jgi:hypothetical protein
MSENTDNPYQSPQASVKKNKEDAKSRPLATHLKAFLLLFLLSIVLAVVLIITIETLERQIVITGLVLIALAATIYYVIELLWKKLGRQNNRCACPTSCDKPTDEETTPDVCGESREKQDRSE